MSTIRELGLPGRAVTALTRAGITDPAVLAGLTGRELSAVPGLGPGLVAAIRAVVPEPPATLPRSAAAPAGPRHPDDEESPAAPAIPSFDSLRAPRRRTAVDLLVPGAPRPAPVSPPRVRPHVEVQAPAAPAPDAPAAGHEVRPPDYADLLRLGVHVARAVASAPARVALWSVREQARFLRRLLGG
ncbi:hypothetical protein [Blastococcus montanus]|uniref:hypothetical protein n=1 Tax=Blastococcus montanus TaxID=3144973 RepID=UPI00320A064B